MKTRKLKDTQRGDQAVPAQRPAASGALRYFDAHAAFGPRPHKHRLERWTLDPLLEDLALAGLSAALVTHEQALNYEPMFANLRLCEQIRPHRARLFPCWVVRPPAAGGFPAPAALLRLMREHDVRAVRLLPKTMGLVPRADVWGELAEALARRPVLVKLSVGDANGFENVDRLLTLFRRSAVLLTDAHWGSWYDLCVLMRRHPNLHLEFSTFQANRAFETLGAEFGCGRLLFGTDLPRKSPGAARALVDLALLKEQAKAMIAGGNLARLLGVDRIPAPLADPRWQDALTAAMARGRPCPARVLDAHSHVLHDGADSAGGSYAMVRGDARGQMELYDRLGVAGVAWMSWNGTVNCDADSGNAVTAAAVAQFPERAFGLVSLDPSHQDAGARAAAIRRYHGQLGFRGLKPYLTGNVRYDAPEYDAWWSFANRYRLYALLHVEASSGGLAAVEPVAKKYPQLTILIAHSGGSYAFAESVAALAGKFPNVNAELTLTPVTNGVVEWLCAAIGPRRVLFGTDAPMRDPRPQLGWVVFTRLPEREKRMILGGNFRRILARGRLPGHSLPAAFR